MKYIGTYENSNKPVMLLCFYRQAGVIHINNIIIILTISLLF